MSKDIKVNENKVRKVSFSTKEIETIRRTVAEKANDDEFRMFMHLAKSYGLDPFNGEIFFWKMNGKPTIMTSRDGYLKIADSHPSYDGIVSDVVRINDVFKRDKEGIDHQYKGNRVDIIGAYALVYRKDRRYPLYVFAPFEEYNAATRVWASYPSAMILKVAESMALKRAFTVSGLVTREEMDVIQDNRDTNRDEGLDSKEDNTETELEEQTLSKREIVIKDIVEDKKELKKDLYSYLRYAKEDLQLPKEHKLKLDDLTDTQFKELKVLLLSMKEREIEVTA